VENALKKVHLLEGTPQCLPLCSAFDHTSFQRVVNTKIAATASFLAYAIYDEMTLKLALTMLRTTLVDPTVNKHFRRKVPKVAPLANVQKEMLESYLFSHNVLDSGDWFVENMVQVAN
jgi:hypothetical protein